MARFNYQDADKYSNGGGQYFRLQDDGDSAKVRFMYNTMDDVDCYAVHSVETADGKKVAVNCLRAYNEPVSKCPFCEARIKTQVKIFVPLYNMDNDSIEFWERGKKYLNALSSLFSRYVGNGDHGGLVSHVFEIERNGAKGDQSTTYREYEVDKDETTIEDLPEVPEIPQGMLADKSADDMLYFLDYNSFPDAAGGKANPKRQESQQQYRRRPPAGNHHEDVY